MTTQLESIISAAPWGSTINLQPNGCYEVSVNPNNPLVLNGLLYDTINGEGATLKQTSYDGGVCNTNAVQPVLWLQQNAYVVIRNLTIDGPGACGAGAFNEGDYGILIGDTPMGSSNVTFSGVNVENTGGDGIAVMPDLGVGGGINKSITFDHGSLRNIGYHGISLEGVNGFTFDNNAVSGVGNFMDMEVDNDCVINGTNECLDANRNPTGIAQWNVTIGGNAFTNGNGGNWIESEQNPCIPQKNLAVVGNTLDSTVPAEIILGGSESSVCPPDSGVFIYANTSTAPSTSPCGGSVATPPACALIEIADYNSVFIGGNVVAADDGHLSYFPNTLYIPCVALGDVTGATVKDNTCNNTWGTDIVGSSFMWTPLNFRVAFSAPRCGNVWGLTEPVVGARATPLTDGACP